jgi:carbon-monoxide dehydrogenase large subunit
MPGVSAVYTNADMGAVGGPLPSAWVPPDVEVKSADRWPLAKDEVNHVGEAIAMVVGASRAAVADAIDEVIVEYKPLVVVVDPEAALAPGSALVHEALGTNKTHEWSLGGGDVEAALAASDVVVERRVVNHRTSGAPIEPRAVLADFRADELTMWSTTQAPHFVRLFASLLLGISEEKVRVIAPDVGGGFGAKVQFCAEEVLLAWASQQLRRPVKWTETRSEHMAVCHHGRDQIAHVRLGAMRDGTLTAIHSRIVADLGAYFGLLTAAVPSMGAFVMTGVYKIPAVQTDIVGVFTNKYFTDAIRGAGRPEATHMIEVCMDQLAVELGMDPIELRRRNFIGPEEFPYETPYGVVYDSGDYEGTLDRMLEMLDLEALRREQATLREQGVYRGVGFSTYTEVCGLAPSRVVGPTGFGLQAGLWESAVVRVHLTGAVTVYTGTSGHGQGHETVFAQLVADKLGVSPEIIDVVHGDTGAGPMGLGTYGSRSIPVGGEAIARAADKVVEKAKRIVAHQLEAAPEDIEVADGLFRVRGTDQGLGLADVSGIAHVRPELMPEGMEPALEEQAFFDPENFVFPFGAHACVVDVDVETGKVTIVRYVAVDDCGNPLNPLLIDGQVHGGIVHGLGQALYEQIVYDENGQLVTGSFVDYALPTAAEMPSFELDRTVTPSPVNSMGVKGIGEAGTIASSPTVVNAILDALRPLGVTYIDMPCTPSGRRAGPLAFPSRREGRCGMIPAEFEYVRPASLQEAIRALADGGEDAKLLAGGHSLIPLMKLRLATPTLLVDIAAVPGLGGIQRENGHWRIGALTRHVDLQSDPALGIAQEAAALIADQQVRNRGTIGGSLAHGDPASDLPTVLVAAEGSVTAQGPTGQRTIGAGELFRDYLTTTLAPDEVLTEVRLPALEGYGHAYEKFTRRAEDWAMVGVCALVKGNDGVCEDVRVAFTNMGSTPLRASALEDALRGQPLTAEAIAAAAEQAADGTSPPADLNASADYKQHLARVLSRRALARAAGLT